MSDTEKAALCARIDELCAEVERLRQQVDTAKHNQTRNAREYARLCHENDGLRELVRDMCVWAYINDQCDLEDEFADTMRELGVEDV